MQQMHPAISATGHTIGSRHCSHAHICQLQKIISQRIHHVQVRDSSSRTTAQLSLEASLKDSAAIAVHHDPGVIQPNVSAAQKLAQEEPMESLPPELFRQFTHSKPVQHQHADPEWAIANGTKKGLAKT